MDRQGYALYFSRAPIAWERDGFAQTPPVVRHAHARHLGIYAYRAGFIRQYVGWQASGLEQIEALEQLRGPVAWRADPCLLLPDAACRGRYSRGSGASPGLFGPLNRCCSFPHSFGGWLSWTRHQAIISLLFTTNRYRKEYLPFLRII